MITGLGALASGATHGHRLGPGFDLLLVAHVACVIVGLGAIVVSGVQAVRALRVAHGTPIPAAVLRYFGPGTNWVGRTLFGVPLFGFALLGASGGSFGLGDDWVMIGLGLWGVAALGAEGLLWPAERRIQRALADPRGPATLDWRRAARRIGAVSGFLVAVLLAATVLMVAQP